MRNFIWKIREYRHGHKLNWPQTFQALGARLVSATRDRTGMPPAVSPQSSGPAQFGRIPSSPLSSTGPAATVLPTAAAAGEQIPMANDLYTLIITTHNRSALLARLLDYLEREGVDFPVMILDSSGDDIRQANASRIARSPLTIRQVVCSPDHNQYFKVKEGSQLVTPPYCSLCADDDFVLLPAVRKCVTLLQTHADFGAVHGSYFNFSETDHFDLSYVVYRGQSLLADDPLVRLREMFASYEAVFYAVYRTSVLQRAFQHVDEVQTLFGRELVSAAVTAVAGKIARINDFYYGRCTGESLSYENWHPHQILVKLPELLFQEYSTFREVVLEEVLLGNTDAGRAESSKVILDLIFLRYLEPFLRSDVVDLIVTDRLAGMDPMDGVEHLWDVFVRCSNRTQHPLEALTGRNGASFGPDLFTTADSPRRDYTFPSQTAFDTPRTYKVFFEFLFPELQPPAIVGRQQLETLFERINSY
jgi:glycosyltransferase domain-containing protein